VTASVDSEDHQRGGSRRRSVARLSAVQALYQLEANPEVGCEAVIREFVRHRFGEITAAAEADPGWLPM
jgi:transcription termination factor NusB